MGYGMCTNIHSKIKADDKLYICDINESALERFMQEKPGKAEVKVFKTPKEVCEHCVCMAVISGASNCWLS